MTLENNLNLIAQTVREDLESFANSLIQKAFISRTAARAILSITAISKEEKVSRLMDSVFTQINTSPDRKRHWFNEFVDIFSHDRAHDELVRRLRGEGKRKKMMYV